LSELKNTNFKQYWKTIKMLIKGEWQSSEYPPLRSPNQNDASAFDNSDKCNLLSDYFCSITDLQKEDILLPDFHDRCPKHFNWHYCCWTRFYWNNLITWSQ
jgi:hypothetical protein